MTPTAVAVAVPPPQPTPLLVRAIVAAIVGALAGALGFIAVYASSPAFVATLDSPVSPSVVRGLHPTEFETGGLAFAWTEGRVTLIFEGLDRSRPWTLQLRAKAGRGSGLPMPTAAIGVDGTPLSTTAIGPQWQDLRATLPTETRTRPTRITVDVAPTFVPGPGDARTLGMILDDVRLVPDGWPAAPHKAWTAAAIAGAIVAALLAVVGVPSGWGHGLLAGFALAQALVLTTGAAPYVRGYLGAVPTIAGGAGLLAAGVAGVAALSRRPLSGAASVATALAAIALVLGLEGLLHPGKAFVDAVFHAHKLDTVLAGQYFFTQPMPSGVEFPYAIGLYVTAAVFAGLTRDHVLLLRVVVAVAHVLAALSLYPVVRRNWQNPAGAAVAVGAYLLAPLPLVVIGNANQTYAFGQSVATIALASAMSWPLGWRRPIAAAGLVGLLSLGLLSHVGLIPLLGGLVGACGLLLAWRGDGDERRVGWLILGATALAAILAVGLYYRHFGDAFRSAQKVGSIAAPAPASPPPAISEAPPSEAAAARPGRGSGASGPGAVVGTSRPQRARRAAGLAVAAYGAPMLVLALVGLSQLPVRTGRDRATLMVVASLLVCVAVAGVSVIAPVEPRFERYTDEFISRLYYAVTPALALLVAAGASWLWLRGAAGRSGAVIGLGLAVVIAARVWLGWIG
jgi:hypothetical protein